MDSKFTMGDLTVALSDVVCIAEGAGKVIMVIYDKPTDDWALQKKTDNSPLTRADLEANEYICAALRKLRADIPIMTEEEKAASYESRRSWTRYWCVDPLDGTKEFVRRNGEFTVNIALMASDTAGAPARPVLGVVHVPATGRTYFGARGCGAFDSSGTRLQASEFAESDTGLTLVCSRSHRDGRTEAFLNGFKAPITRAVGSSLKFMLVAEGAAHVYPRLAPTCEWDTAASQIIVEEAGGAVLRESDGLPVVYNKEDLLNPFFIVYGKRRAVTAEKTSE